MNNMYQLRTEIILVKESVGDFAVVHALESKELTPLSHVQSIAE